MILGELDSALVERVISTVTLNANSAADQVLHTHVGQTLVTKLVFDNASASLLLAVAEVGYNVGVDDWQPAIVLATLTAAGLMVVTNPILGAARGAASGVLSVHFTVLAGAAANVRCRVIGIGG